MACMTNPSKQRGTKFETDCVKFAQANGFPDARRQPLAGSADRGDIWLCSGVVLECKATRSIALAAAVDEAQAEARNAGVEIGIAVIKRRNHGTGDAYAVLPYELLLAILEEGGWK